MKERYSVREIVRVGNENRPIPLFWCDSKRQALADFERYLEGARRQGFSVFSEQPNIAYINKPGQDGHYVQIWRGETPQ